MKKIVVILILVTIVLSFIGCSDKDKTDRIDSENGNITDSSVVQETTNSSRKSELKSLSEELALQMEDGKFDDTFKKLSLTIKAETNEELLKQAWEATVAGMGAYIEVYESKEEAIDNKLQSVTVILRYENNGLKVFFSYNKKGIIEGLWFNYSPIEPEAVSNEVLEETKITIGKGEYAVTGMLTMPKGIANPPVVILVPGSGTHDMNEIVGANKPFEDIAWGLAKLGIASIRYNERLFQNPALAANKITIELDSLDDASQAISFAISCDKINKDKIYVLGHSLGGMMMPKIASEHKEIAGILILAGSPRKLEDIVYDQNMEALANIEGITKKQIAETVTVIEDQVTQIKILKDTDTAVLLGQPATYWYSLNQIDTPKLTAGLTIPIFIAQGSEDFQAYADKDYVKWQELLSDNDNVTFHLYDGLNHLFMTTNGKKDITEYNIKGHVEQRVIDDIVLWIKQ